MGDEKRTDMGRATRLVIDNLQNINKKLDALQGDVSLVKTDIVVIKKDVNNLQSKDSEIAETVKKHEGALYGNGKPGLLTDMAIMKKSMKPIEDTKEKFFNTALQWVVLLGAILLGYWGSGKIPK
ncbi:hypothetical protein AAIR98_001427 [Elusimicrobium simillimum]|uniref:hypothetical protein n=1 Tax=Elusimicrobium simillimum TaxID=3143438 RepID=UPI003C700260